MNKKINRNDPCRCGSGKKYKKCCWSKEVAKEFKASKLTGGASSIANAFSNAITSSTQIDSALKKINAEKALNNLKERMNSEN